MVIIVKQFATQRLMPERLSDIRSVNQRPCAYCRIYRKNTRIHPEAWQALYQGIELEIIEGDWKPERVAGENRLLAGIRRGFRTSVKLLISYFQYILFGPGVLHGLARGKISIPDGQGRALTAPVKLLKAEIQIAERCPQRQLC